MKKSENVPKAMQEKYKEDTFSKDKKADGFIKQLILIIGLGIALIVFALLTSGIFFTGAVVQSMNSDIKVTVHK